MVVEDQAPVGVVTERDLVRALGAMLAANAMSKPRAGELMAARPFTVTLESPVSDAIRCMRDNRIRHLPVTDGKDTSPACWRKTNCLAGCSTWSRTDKRCRRTSPWSACRS